MTDTKLAKTEADTEQFAPVADGAHRPTTFKHVLVGVDDTSTGRDAIALAETLRHPDGRITLAHVVPVEVARYRNFHSTPAGKNVRASSRASGPPRASPLNSPACSPRPSGAACTSSQRTTTPT
jgi:hypothetical protein